MSRVTPATSGSQTIEEFFQLIDRQIGVRLQCDLDSELAQARREPLQDVERRRALGFPAYIGAKTVVPVADMLASMPTAEQMWTRPRDVAPDRVRVPRRELPGPLAGSDVRGLATAASRPRGTVPSNRRSCRNAANRSGSSRASIDSGSRNWTPSKPCATANSSVACALKFAMADRIVVEPDQHGHLRALHPSHSSRFDLSRSHSMAASAENSPPTSTGAVHGERRKSKARHGLWLKGVAMDSADFFRSGKTREKST